MIEVDWEIIKTYPFLSEEELEISNWLLSDKIAQANWPTIAVYLEQQQEMNIISTLCLSHLNKVFAKATIELDQEVYLRILLIIGKQLGKLWTVFRTWEVNDGFSLKEYLKLIAQQQEVSKRKDYIFCLWNYTVEFYQLFSPKLQQFSSESLIIRGLSQEVKTIINMLIPQKRVVFQNETIWLSDQLTFRMIKKGDESLLEKNLTANVGKYLSIDSFFHPLFTQEYIKQSILEMEYGTCLVLMIFHTKTDEFIGSCTLNDINKETIEIGLWIKENQQNKGFGTEIMKLLLQIIEENKLSTSVLYTAEKENEASILLCNKFSFQQTDQFILEPNPLKNKYREMIQFSYYL